MQKPSSSNSRNAQDLEDIDFEVENRADFQVFNADFDNEDLSDRFDNIDSHNFSSEDKGPETKYHWENLIFFLQSQLTVRDTLAMVRGFSLRFGLSLEARLALVNLLKIFAGPEFDNLNLSNYKISRMFESGGDKLTFCFYCSSCKSTLLTTNKKKVKNPEGLCDKCGSRCNLSTKNDKYIIMVDLKYQIERLFKLKDVKTTLIKLHRGQTRIFARDNSICDLQDGHLFKRLNPTNFSTVLTLNIFSDGAIMKRSGSEHFWSALVQINEIPISLRMKYIMLAGVMTVSKEPKPELMNSFITEFIKQIELLNEESIELKVGNLNIRFSFKILFCIVDSVARLILQFRIQYNGFSGCSWCYQRGCYISIVRYLFDPNFQLRSHELHLEDVRSVQIRQENVNIRKIRDTFVNGVNDMI